MNNLHNEYIQARILDIKTSICYMINKGDTEAVKRLETQLAQFIKNEEVTFTDSHCPIESKDCEYCHPLWTDGITITLK